MDLLRIAKVDLWRILLGGGAAGPSQFRGQPSAGSLA
jgi:hypothetical protein